MRQSLRLPQTSISANPSLPRRDFLQLTALAACSLAAPAQSSAPSLVPANVRLEIAPVLVEASPKHLIRTLGYNGQVPGPLLRMRQGVPQIVEVHNKSTTPEVVHWHGLFLPSAIDGAMEEGTPMLAPGETARYTITPEPAGAHWYHTHTFAGGDMTRAQYGGQHGQLYIEPREHAGSYDREFFLTLHDWMGRLASSDDGSMNPLYELSTINGKILGFGEPLRVRQGERVQMHILNSSPTEVHWIALAGHTFQVLALDGNFVPRPQAVQMLRLAPAERVTAIVEMNAPGKWVLGEARRHVQAAGMGIVVEYAERSGDPQWVQPESLQWDYVNFAAQPATAPANRDETQHIELTFDSKFVGHGSQELWRINGKSYPHTDEPVLHEGQRYRLVLRNNSMDDHPVHLHRHSFEVCSIAGTQMRGLIKDVVLAPSHAITEVEFIANNPGRTLFHCHQQNHMDRGFMMVFRYA